MNKNKLEKTLIYCLFALFFMALGFVGGQRVQQHWDEKKMIVDYEEIVDFSNGK